MPLNFGFQSRAQLDAVSSVFADELDDTIASKFIMRVQGDATSQYAVRLLGMYDVREVGTSNSPGEWRDSTSMRYAQKARIEQRQLRELQPGEVYISTLQQRDDAL
jgi:type IV secretory pathway TraG/TraD family ATPase VirD4